MAVFAIIAPEFDPRLENALKQHFEVNGNMYTVAPGQYLVATKDSTTRQIAEITGIMGGSVGRAIVLRLENYTGWHARDMWEWIDSRLNPPQSSGVQEGPDDQ